MSPFARDLLYPANTRIRIPAIMKVIPTISWLLIFSRKITAETMMVNISSICPKART